MTAHYNSTPRELSTTPDLVALQADVTSESDVERLFSQAEAKQCVPVQVLVVNHGIWPVQAVPLSDMSLDQWRNTHSVNLDGAFLLVRSFLSNLKGKPANITDPASICFIGSTAGKFGEHDHADYASTKSASTSCTAPIYNSTATLASTLRSSRTYRSPLFFSRLPIYPLS